MLHALQRSLFTVVLIMARLPALQIVQRRLTLFRVWLLRVPEVPSNTLSASLPALCTELSKAHHRTFCWFDLAPVLALLHSQ